MFIVIIIIVIIIIIIIIIIKVFSNFCTNFNSLPT